MRKEKYAFLDFDGVLYEDSIAGPLLKHLIKTGILDHEFGLKIITIYQKYKSNEISQKDTAELAFPIVADALIGKPYELLAESTLDLLKNGIYFTEFSSQLIETLRQHEYLIYICTLNGDFVADAVTRFLNLDGYISSKFEIEDGEFTSEVESLMLNKNQIEEVLDGNTQNSLAVGDSENDITMLETVEIPIAINPNDKLKKVAVQKGWHIVNDSNIISTVKKLVAYS